MWFGWSWPPPPSPPAPAPQEVARGSSLAQMLAEGKRCGPAEVERIAGQLLDVLQYLGGLSPPVIHR